MREIKFRAWDTQFKRMLNNVAVCNGIVPHIGHHCEIMQFTGLKDKTGKEIYEGDIVRTTLNYAENEIGVIRWSYHKFIAVTTGNSALLNRRVTAQMFGSKGVEIIGNIYENPELLKGV